MIRMSLTARQRDCFEVIQHHIENLGQAPSRRELARLLGLRSPGHVILLLTALQERGWITMLPNRARSITIVPEDAACPGHVLPPLVEAKLRAHCAASGEKPDDVVADAVALFFDEAEGRVAA